MGTLLHDPGPTLRIPARGHGTAGLKIGLLLLVAVVVLLAATTVLDLRDRREVAAGFVRSRAATVMQGLARAYRQGADGPATLASLAAEIDDPEVLLLEFLGPGGRVLASTQPEAVGTVPYPPALLRTVLAREEPLVLERRPAATQLDVWSLLLPPHGPFGRGRGPGAGWRRAWRQGWLQGGGQDPVRGPDEEPPEAEGGPPKAPLATAGGMPPAPGVSPVLPDPPVFRAGGGPVVAHLVFSTAEAERLVQQAWLRAGVVGLALLLLLSGGVLVLFLQRRTWQLAQELGEQQRLASLGSLSAVLAHEIRNPLAAVKGHAQYALEKASDDPALAEGLGIIVEESTRLEKLVRDLLDYARPRPLDLQPVDLDELVDRLLRLRAPEFQARHVSLVWRAGLGRKALIDGEAVTQVMHNLVGNALEALGEGGTLTVRLDEDGPWLCLTVADDGPGIPPELLERIFDPYITTRTRGTGLGLAVARQAVEGLGGRIVARNQAPRGAVFEISLRRAPRER